MVNVNQQLETAGFTKAQVKVLVMLREEDARNFVTKQDFTQTINQLLSKFDDSNKAFRADMMLEFHSIREENSNFHRTIIDSIKDFRIEIKEESTKFRSEMEGNFKDFKLGLLGEFKDFKTEMQTEFRDFKTEVKFENREFKTEMRADHTVLRGEMKSTRMMTAFTIAIITIATFTLMMADYLKKMGLI